MGIESAPQNPLGRVDVTQLVRPASEVVNPTSIDLLSNAVRSGFITADDITRRIDQRPADKARNKATVQLAGEETSPEAVEMRKNQRAAASAEAKGSAQVAPLAVTAKESELKAAILDAQMKGAGVLEMQNALSKAGWPVPVDPNKGFTESDQKEVTRRFGVLLNFLTEKAKADSLDKDTEVKNPEIEITDAAGAVVRGPSNIPSITHKGQAVPVEKFKQLQQYKTMLQGMTPAGFDALGQPKAPSLFGEAGQVQAAPVQPTPAVQPVAPMVFPKGPAASQSEAIIRDQQLSQQLPDFVQPKAAPAVETKPMIEPEATPGQPFGPISMVTGKKDAKALKTADPRTVAEELSSIDSDLKAVDEAKAIISAGKVNVVGPGAGSRPAQVLNQVGAALGFREQEFESQDRLLQLVNKRVLEGAQKMKGNLSDKDIRFLKESFPSLTSNETVWTDFLDKWKGMLNLNQEVIRGVAPKGSSIFDEAQQRTAPPAGVAPAPSAAAPAGPVITLSSGRKVRRNANGGYDVVQ